MFWLQPTLQGVLKTIPLRTGGRSVQMGGSIFMGQVHPNRLDAVSIPAIIGRIQLDPAIQAYLSGLSAKKASMNGVELGMAFAQRPQPTPSPNFLPMTDAEAQVLFEISKNPSDEELKDLATIDNLFSQSFYDSTTTTNEVCYYTKNGFPRENLGLKFAPPAKPITGEIALIDYFRPPPAPVVSSKWGAPKKVAPPETPFLDDKFWCPDPNSIGPGDFQAYMPLLGKFSSFASMFGIDTSKTWGEIKLATENGLTMLKVKVSYPLPPPLDMAPDFVWNMAAGPHVVEMANLGVRVDPEAFKAWYTMAVLESYDAASDAIIAEQKRKAKKAKRKAIIKAVVITIAGIVLSFIVPGIIGAAISAIKTAVEMYIAAKERQKAAKAMAEAAKMFEADAPAFATEVQKTADMLDSAAAQEEANTPLTQEQLDAIQEVKENPEPGTGPSTGSLVVTGVAATGVVAALIAIFK